MAANHNFLEELRWRGLIHDFTPGGKTSQGKKIVLFTSRVITDTALDGDHDGLSKGEEIKHGTVLWLADSDGDGFTDGQEVAAGYLPTLAEWTLPDGTLIKSAEDPHVYLLNKKTKQHIVSEEVFLSHGWKWGDIRIVSERFLGTVPVGSDIEK